MLTGNGVLQSLMPRITKIWVYLMKWQWSPYGTMILTTSSRRPSTRKKTTVRISQRKTLCKCVLTKKIEKKMTYPMAAMTSQRATSTKPRMVKTNQTTSIRSYNIKENQSENRLIKPVPIKDTHTIRSAPTISTNTSRVQPRMTSALTINFKSWRRSLRRATTSKSREMTRSWSTFSAPPLTLTAASENHHLYLNNKCHNNIW